MNRTVFWADHKSQPDARRCGIVDFVPATILLAVLIIALAVIYVSQADDDDQYLIVAPIGWSMARTLNLAVSNDARLVKPGRWSNTAFVISPRTDFASTARAAGAWLVLPVPAAWDCGGADERAAL